MTRDLTPQLHDARVIAKAWASRTRPYLIEEYESACNLAIAQGCQAWVPERGDFAGFCRCLMHRRCTDVLRYHYGGVRVYQNGREYRRHGRPALVAWEQEWGDRWVADPYTPDDTAWRAARAVEAVKALPVRRDRSHGPGVSQRTLDGVLLYLELGSMEAVAERMGITQSRVSQYLAEVGRAVREAAA